MKRYIPAIIIFSLILSGYYLIKTNTVQGPQAAQAEEDDHPKEATETGMITSLGNIIVSGSGTHILTKSDRTTILLTGLGANLDNYVGTIVEVEGRLSRTASGKELIQVLHVNSVKASEELKNTDVDAMKWEAFEETVNLGVSLRRRHGWKLAETKTSLTFTIIAEKTGDKDDTIQIERVPNTKNEPLQNFTGDPKASTKNLIGPHKLIGYKRIDKGVITFAIAREKSVFVIKYTPGAVRGIDPSANDFYTMMSSFDFVPVGTPAKTASAPLPAKK